MAKNVSNIKPISKETPKPIPTLETIIQRACSEGIGGERMKEIANRLDALSEMLDNARDRGATREEDIRYLADVAGGVQWLISAIADDVRWLSNFPIELSKASMAFRDAQKGGAE